MATQPISGVEHALENIVSNPIRATLTVGICIIILFEVVHELMLIWPGLRFLLYIVPFIPPYFITKTAKNINQRVAEHDFIKDAVPYVFVAYPKEASIDSLLEIKPEMISNSAAEHFNQPIAALLNNSVLPPAFFHNPEDRKSLVTEFVRDYHAHGGHGVIRAYKITLQPHGGGTAQDYLVNGVLKNQGKRIKWQATLMRCGDADALPNPQEAFS